MIFYMLAFVPLVIGAIIWLFNKRVIWQEWLFSSIIGFIMAGIFHFTAIQGMTGDVQTLSGQIQRVIHVPRWKEYYEEAIYRTEYYWDTERYTVRDSQGNSSTKTRRVRKSRRVFDHWEPRSRWHEASWKAHSNIQTSYDIDAAKFEYFVAKYNKKVAKQGDRTTGEHNSRMLEGDPNDYHTDPSKTRWIEPVTKLVSWQNRIKSAPSIFSFVKVNTNVPVANWPENPSPFLSERVIGHAQNYINPFAWDQLNADLGPRKHVNLILVGFESDDAMLGQWQRAKWVGGKKNDFVITLGGKDLKNPSWVYVFGWTESELAKQNITAYLLRNGLDTNFMTFVQNEIISNYTIKDWKKFDYISIEPAPRYYYWFIGVLSVSMVGLYVFFHQNEFSKEGREDDLTAGRITMDFKALKRLLKR